MPEITDEGSLKAWLDTRPNEDARLIAARAALRGLPGLESLLRSDRIKYPFAIILSVFHALEIASIAAKWPAQRLHLQDTAHYASKRFAGHAKYARSAARAASTNRHATVILASASAAGQAQSSAGGRAFSVYEPTDTHSHRPDSVSNKAARTAASALWTAVEQDANGLEDGIAHGAFMKMPLWHEEGPPEGLAEAWPDLRDRLLAEDPLWHVWTDWYQDRLDGKPMIEALEVEKALIPNEDWEKGPAHVNAIIAGLIEKHAIAKHAKSPVTILEWLGGNQLRLALADWSLDQMDRFMELVPFSNDYRDLHSDDEKRARREGLQALSDAMTEMAEDVEDLRLNPPWVDRLIRDLQRYAREANKGADRALPANLLRHGRNLRETWLSADCAKTLGDAVTKRLGGLVDEHTAWLRLFLSGTLQRMQHLNEVALPAGMTSADLTTIIRTGVDAVVNNDWSAAKGANDSDKAVLLDMAEAMERLNAERDASAGDPARQAYLDDEIRRNGIISGATLVRFGLQSAKASKDGVAIAADAKTLWPENFKDFFEAIQSIFQSGGPG